MKKRILSFVTAFVLLIGLVPGSAFATETTSGSCGDSVEWFLQNDGTLVLSGSGRTDNYGGYYFQPEAPWSHLVDQITSIHVQGEITYLGTGLFSDCENAVGIILPDTLEYFSPDGMPPNVQFYIANGENYVADSGVLYGKNVDPDGFETSNGVYCLVKYPRNANYTSYTLRPETKAIASGAFSNCENLKTVVLNDGLETISSYAFSWCTSLNTLEIPFGVTEVGHSAFEGCLSLYDLTLPSSLTAIDTSIFWGCESLEAIEIPASVTSVTSDVSGPDGGTINLDWHQDYYFQGDAPEEFGVDSVLMDPFVDGGGYIFTYVRSDIYYPEGASGWTELIQKYEDSVFVRFYPYTWEEDEDVELTFSVSRSSVTIPMGNQASPRATLNPSNAQVRWTSSNEAVAQVNSGGTVTGIYPGTAWITGTATYGDQVKTVAYTVQVTANLSVAFTNRTVNLNAGDTEDIRFTYRPINQVVYAESSNPSVVEIVQNSSANGAGTLSVRAVGAGTAELTIRTSLSGSTASDTCTIVVENNGEAIAQRFVDKAFSYKGMNESTFENSTGYNVPSSWCAAFVSVCARTVGIPTNIIPNATGTATLLSDVGTAFYFSDWEYNLATTADKNYLLNAHKVQRGEFEPQVGDLVFIRWNGNTGLYPPHVGIVYSVNTSQQTMTIVDGGAGSNPKTVKIRTNISYTAETIFSMQNCTLMAYARPNWSAASGVVSGKTSDRANCPVDIQVSYNGEVLDSATNQLTASFGSMTVTGDGDDRSISLELNDYYSEAETIINGTGTGTMTFSTTSEDEDGTTGTRTFANVPITPDTIICVIRSNSAVGGVALEVYSDDGDTLEEVWYADQATSSVSEADEELTNWYLYGDDGGDDVTIPDPTPNPDVDDSNSSNSSDSGDYLITIDRISGGRITVQPGRADKGDTVTITVYPNDGYKLDELVVTDKNGDAVQLTDKGGDKYIFTMPAGKVNVKANFVLEIEKEILTFTDVSENAYYYDAVAWAVENGITNGTSATTFGPDISCTRAQMVTFLWRAAGSPEPESTVKPFTDVSSSAYYYDAVLWAVEQGITNGTSATTFGPDATVTRGQTVTFLWRYNGSPAVSGSGFDDVAADAYYADAVAWAASEGVTSGTGATTFSPDNDCTRGQIVTFLYRYMG